MELFFLTSQERRCVIDVNHDLDQPAVPQCRIFVPASKGVPVVSMGQGADWKHSEPAGVLTHLKVATADPGAVVMVDRGRTLSGSPPSFGRKG